MSELWAIRQLKRCRRNVPRKETSDPVLPKDIWFVIFQLEAPEDNYLISLATKELRQYVLDFAMHPTHGCILDRISLNMKLIPNYAGGSDFENIINHALIIECEIDVQESTVYVNYVDGRRTYFEDYRGIRRPTGKFEIFDDSMYTRNFGHAFEYCWREIPFLQFLCMDTDLCNYGDAEYVYYKDYTGRKLIDGQLPDIMRANSKIDHLIKSLLPEGRPPMGVLNYGFRPADDLSKLLSTPPANRTELKLYCFYIDFYIYTPQKRKQGTFKTPAMFNWEADILSGKVWSAILDEKEYETQLKPFLSVTWVY